TEAGLKSAGVANGDSDDLVLATTPCVNGFAGVYACSGIDLAARLPLSSFTPSPPSALSEVWGWTDPQTGKEIALVGLSNGIGFVDVTVPDAPVYLGKLPSAVSDPSGAAWRTFRTDGTYLFVGSEMSGHGVQVFNLTRLRGVTAPQSFTADARYTRVSNVHTLTALNGYLYLAGSNSTVGATNPTCTAGGLHIVDVRNPLTPTFAGCYQGDGYTHEAQCLTYTGPDATYAGRDLCFAYQGEPGSTFASELSVVDMTNKAAPARFETAEYPNVGYSHQGWLTSDSRYILINDEFDTSAQGVRTVVMNATDLDNIEFAFNSYGSIATYAHNIFVKGRYAYTSDYTQGLRILDTSTIASGTLPEVGRFDTFNQNNGRAYSGQWMNYPYFASGTVVASDIQNGLFVLRPTALAVAGEAGVPDAETGLALSAPAPNPASDQTRFVLSTGAPQHVRVALYDALGREVRVLLDGLADGETELTVRRETLPTGTYVVRVTGEQGTATRRVVFAR
ncbi:MAG TPA: choice-of-anchor B family protein, partial [Rubricoccaceae bacterium]